MNLTREEIAQLPVGKELDELIAIEALGLPRQQFWHPIPCPDNISGCLVAHGRVEFPHYSTDIKLAWQIIDVLTNPAALTERVLVSVFQSSKMRHSVSIDRVAIDDTDTVVKVSKPVTVEADTVALAICRAALLAMLA